MKPQLWNWSVKPMGKRLLAIFAGVCGAVSVRAQDQVFADLDQINAGGQASNDIAKIIMRGLLGPMFDSPLSSGLATNTLFGVLFLAFNVVVFTAGVVWATYGVGSGIVQSAHEGVVLGKRMSAVWMPIRLATGIGALIPVFGGFSLSQVIMIIATGWGITFGNFAYNKALDATANFAPLVNVSLAHNSGEKDSLALAYAIFAQRLCELDFLEKERLFKESGTSLAPSDQLTARSFEALNPPGSRPVGSALGTDNDPLACGAVGIKWNFNETGRSAESDRGFRVGSVDYAAIASTAYARYASNWPAFFGSMRQLADNWITQSRTAITRLPVPEAAILSNAQAFTGVIREGAGKESANAEAVKKTALEKMRQYGFFGAGAFYATFAEVNAGVLEAQRSVGYVIQDSSQTSAKLDAASSGEFMRYRIAFKERRGSSSSSVQEDGKCKASATGDCSWGQHIMKIALGRLTEGSGDGSATAGGFRILDPIIASKNLGDYMMVAGESLLVVGGALDGAAGVLTSIPVIGKILKGAIGVLPVIGGVLLGVGALLALYIPMVPFINWVSALVQYVCVVVEAMAAAPLWAFAHLHAEGEGMGQRSEKGYLYLLLLLFKPILMVIGFFAAAGLTILLGSAVLWLFLPAVANVQGNSVTGLVSIIGLLLMFFLLMNILIQGLFNLVQEISDDTIGWVGNLAKSQMGRDIEGRAHSLFTAGSRVMSQVITKGK
ncbi:MAG: DotA/TraY family protein [Pseudomonadota bacterium]